MQATKNGYGDEFRGGAGWGQLRMPDGRIAVQSLVRPNGVIVVIDELSEQAP